MPARKRAAEAAADEANAGVELAAYGTSAGTSTAPPPAPLHCLECGKSCATPFAMEMHFRKWPVCAAATVAHAPMAVCTHQPAVASGALSAAAKENYVDEALETYSLRRGAESEVAASRVSTVGHRVIEAGRGRAVLIVHALKSGPGATDGLEPSSVSFC
jgi:hypothetical protein